jgi:hypothetical protein
MCWTLDLDPAEIWSAFDHDYSHLCNPFDDSGPKDRGGRFPRGVLSQTLSMNFWFDQYAINQLSVLLIPAVGHGDVPTGKLSISSKRRLG